MKTEVWGAYLAVLILVPLFAASGLCYWAHYHAKERSARIIAYLCAVTLCAAVAAQFLLN